MECSKKIDTISISPKPRIKCYAVNHKTCNDDVGKKPIEKITNLTGSGRENQLIAPVIIMLNSIVPFVTE